MASRFSAKILDFVGLLVLARLLTPGDFGLVAMALTLVQVIEAILELPVAQALLRGSKLTQSATDTAFTLSFLRGLVLALIIGFLAHPIAIYYGDSRLVPLIGVLTLAVILRGLISPRMAVFQRDMNFFWDAILDVVAKASAIIAGISVAIMTRSYWALATVTLTTPLITVILSYIRAPYRPRFSLAEWPMFSNIVGWFSVSQVFSALNWQIDKFVLGRFTTPVSLGRYSMSEQMAAVPFTAIIAPSVRPLTAAFARDESQSQLHRAYCQASNALFAIAGPILVIAIVFAKPLLLIAFDDEWTSAAPLLQGLCLGNLLVLPIGPVNSLAIATNRTGLVAARNFYDFLFRGPATVIGIIYGGLMGAVAARTIAQIGVFFFGMLVTTKIIKLPIRTQIQALLRPSIAMAAMALFLILTLPFTENLSGLMLIVAVALLSGIASSLYGMILLGLWLIAGRPNGIEALTLQKVGLSKRLALA